MTGMNMKDSHSCGGAADGNAQDLTPAMTALVARTRDILSRGTDGKSMEALEKAVAAAMHAPDLLTPAQKECAAACYRRHVVHVDKTVPFTILSLVWRPGQKTPVHGHRAWCAVGIAQGGIDVETFHCREDGTLEKKETIPCRVGATCIETPGDGDIHRLSNGSHGLAVSLHIYGLDLTEDPAQINVIFDEALCQGGQP